MSSTARPGIWLSSRGIGVPSFSRMFIYIIDGFTGITNMERVVNQSTGRDNAFPQTARIETFLMSSVPQ